MMTAFLQQFLVFWSLHCVLYGLSSGETQAGDDYSHQIINEAFKQMSTNCFGKLDCEKCRDSFHDSTSQIQSTIFAKFDNDFAKAIDQTLTSASESLKHKLYNGCLALQNLTSTHQTLLTTYSGTAKDDGVFLSILYSVVPQLSQYTTSESSKIPSTQLLIDTDERKKHATPDAWAHFIPDTYRHYSKMGEDFQQDQAAYASKFLKGKSNSDDTVRKLSDAAPQAPYLFFVTDSQNDTIAKIFGQMPNMKEILNSDIHSLPEEKFIPLLNEAVPSLNQISNLNSFPSVNLSNFMSSASLKDFIPKNFSTFVPSSFRSVVPSSITPSSFEKVKFIPVIGVSKVLQKLQEKIDSSTGLNDLAAAANSSQSTSASPTTTTPAWKSPPHVFQKSIQPTEAPTAALLFLDPDVQFVGVSAVSADFVKALLKLNDPRNDTIDKESLRGDREALNKKIDEMIEAFIKAAEFGKRKAADNKSLLKDDLFSMNQVSSVPMNAAEKIPYGMMQPLSELVQLADGQHVKGTPLSFYVKINDGKISHLEEISGMPTSKLDVTIDSKKEEKIVEKDLNELMTSVGNLLRYYWDSLISGNCQNMTSLLSDEFEGISNNFDLSSSMNTSTEKIWGAFNSEINEMEGLTEKLMQDTHKVMQSDPSNYYQQLIREKFASVPRFGSIAASLLDLNAPKEVQGVVKSQQDSPNPSFLDQMIKRGIELQQKEGFGFNYYFPSNNPFHTNPFVELVDSTPHLINFCKLFQSAGLMDQYVPTVHDVFYNPSSHHGIALLNLNSNFISSSSHAAAALNSSDFMSLFQNLTQTAKQKLSEKEKEVHTTVNQLKERVQGKYEELKQKAKSTSDGLNRKKNDYLQQYRKFAETKLNEAQKGIQTILDECRKRISRTTKDVEDCKDDDCRTASVSCQFDRRVGYIETVGYIDRDIILSYLMAAEGMPIVTYFKSTPDGKQIKKMINFEAFKFPNSDFFPNLGTAVQLSGDTAALNLHTMLISAGLVVAILTAWLALNMKSKSRTLPTELTEALTTQRDLNANYHRIQDV